MRGRDITKRETRKDYIKRDKKRLYRKRQRKTTTKKRIKVYKKRDREIQREIIQRKMGENKEW